MTTITTTAARFLKHHCPMAFSIDHLSPLSHTLSEYVMYRFHVCFRWFQIDFPI